MVNHHAVTKEGGVKLNIPPWCRDHRTTQRSSYKPRRMSLVSRKHMIWCTSSVHFFFQLPWKYLFNTFQVCFTTFIWLLFAFLRKNISRNEPGYDALMIILNLVDLMRIWRRIVHRNLYLHFTPREAARIVNENEFGFAF